MRPYRFGARRSSPSSLQALDFGLRVRLDAHSCQRSIFAGAENLSVQELVSELSEMVSSLRVRSFSLRAQVEDLTVALMTNTECGLWPLAGRAAMDLGDLLTTGGRRGLADPELCDRGAGCAFRIAELLAKESR